MRVSKALCAAAMIVALPLIGVARNQLFATPVQAANYHTNPAPFGNFKVQITPPALLGLARQQSSSQTGNAPPDGAGNNPYALQPRKPAATSGIVASGSAPGGSNVGSGPQGGVNTPPPNSLLFNNDPSAVEQNETTVTVAQNGAVPTNSGLSDQVVGGANDSRGFFYAPAFGCGPTVPNQCYPARNCVSLSLFSVSLNGGSGLSKSDCLPWVNGTFQPFGDPALDRDTSGNVYYGSLGFDSTAGSGQNGIVLERSTSQLFNPSNPCQNVAGPSGQDNSNPCWKGQVVSVGNTSTNPNTGKCDPTFCTFADKDWIAVDRYSGTSYQGDVYVAWNSFTVAGPKNGTTQIFLSRCHPDAAASTGFDYCTSPVSVSQPSDIFTGGGSYLTVTRDGHVLLTYANFGTATTLYPIDYRVAVIAPGGQSVLGYINVAHLTQNGDNTTTPCLRNTDPPSSFEFGAPCKDNTGLDALAGVTMRAPEFLKIDVDRSTGSLQNMVYTTFELCTLPQFYSDPTVGYPGNCPKTDVFVARTKVSFGSGNFTNTPVAYTDVTANSPGQQFFPYVSVDERSGHVVVTYNTTEDDQFQNMDSVRAMESVNGGQTFIPLQSSTGARITAYPYQITKDPAGYFGQGFPPCGPGGSLGNAAGCPGYAPENGDYLQGLAYFGRLYTHYTGTYVQKAFTPSSSDLLTFFDGSLPMNQDDNYLNRSFFN